MTLGELLTRFGDKHTGRPFALDDNGVCQIAFHEGRALGIEPVGRGDRAFIYSAIAPLPGRDAANVYGKLLAANLFGDATNEACFAIDPATEEILLHRAFETNHMDLEAFEQLVTGFMDTVEIWMRELERPDFSELEAEEEMVTPGLGRPGEEAFIIRG
jgi:hypothetical protein